MIPSPDAQEASDRVSWQNLFVVQTRMAREAPEHQPTNITLQGTVWIQDLPDPDHREETQTSPEKTNT